MGAECLSHNMDLSQVFVGPEALCVTCGGFTPTHE